MITLGLLFLLFAAIICVHSKFVIQVRPFTIQNNENNTKWHQISFKNISDFQVVTTAEEITEIIDDIPEDDGGNYGDLLHLERKGGDSLILRETIINQISHGPQDLRISGYLPPKITHIRALNFGRERAFVYMIANNENGYVQINMAIKAKLQVRVSIEVYGIK